uniref:RNA-directed DNA polymerase n=1 Tax=Strigamia maritima TaxID=126957 RepID=T1JDH5_STRMM
MVVTRLPFGTMPSAGAFQRSISTVLGGVPSMHVYLDDILIATASWKQHCIKLLDAGLRLALEKSNFGKKELDFLGFHLSGLGLSPIESKVQALIEIAPPEDKSQSRTFIGIVNFYSVFVKELASLAAPLYELLCEQVKWSWANKQQSAFVAVNTHLDAMKPRLNYARTSDAVVQRNFMMGESVWYQVFPKAVIRWHPGIVTEIRDAVVYVIKDVESDQLHVRHLNCLRRRILTNPEVEVVVKEPSQVPVEEVQEKETLEQNMRPTVVLLKSQQEAIGQRQTTGRQRTQVTGTGMILRSRPRRSYSFPRYRVVESESEDENDLDQAVWTGEVKPLPGITPRKVTSESSSESEQEFASPKC